MSNSIQFSIFSYKFIRVFRYEFTLHLEKGKEYKFNKAEKKCVANQKVLTKDSRINFRGLECICVYLGMYFKFLTKEKYDLYWSKLSDIASFWYKVGKLI